MDFALQEPQFPEEDLSPICRQEKSYKLTRKENLLIRKHNLIIRVISLQTFDEISCEIRMRNQIPFIRANNSCSSLHQPTIMRPKYLIPLETHTPTKLTVQHLVILFPSSYTRVVRFATTSDTLQLKATTRLQAKENNRRFSFITRHLNLLPGL